MRLKKLLGITLLAIPLYFFTPSVAKSEELRINLKNKEISTEQAESVKGNIFNDLDFGSFVKKANERLEHKIYEERFLLDISHETRYFLFNWENTTRHMNDMEKKLYMEKVNNDLERVIKKEFKNEMQEEFKDSKFCEWFKEEFRYYRGGKKSSEEDVKVREKEDYIHDKGYVSFGYKKEKFGDMSAEEKIKLKSRKGDASVEHKDFFEFKIKLDPFGFKSWNYSPRINFDLTTKYFSVHGKTSYSFNDEKFKASISTMLPERFVLSFKYDQDGKDDGAHFTTKLSRKIKDYTLSLNGTKTHDNKDRFDERRIMFTIEDVVKAKVYKNGSPILNGGKNGK